MNDTLYLLVCRICDRDQEPWIIPFSSPAERGKWAATHTRGTGHDQWWVHDTSPGVTPEPAQPSESDGR